MAVVMPSYPDAPPPRLERPRGVRGRWRAARASLAGMLLARQKRWVVLMLSLVALSSFVGFFGAQVTIGLVNHGIVLQDVPLREYVAPAVTVAVATLILSVAAGLVTGRVGYYFEFDLRTWVYTRLQAAERSAIDSVASGQVLTRAQQDLSALELFISVMPRFVALLPLLFVMCVVVTVLNPIMGVLTIAALPINLLILRRMRGRLRGLSWMELNESAEVTNAVVEPVLGIRVVHAFHRQDFHQSRLAAVALRAYRVTMTKARMVARFDLPLKSIPTFINAAALWVGAGLVSGDALSLGTFAFAMGAVGAMTTISALVDQLAVIWQLLRGSQDRFLELLRLERGPASTGALPLGDPRLGLQVDDVTVTRGNRAVLERFSLRLAPGDLVVVSGTAGSGKSTLAGLLGGSLTADSGATRMEGVDWGDLSPSAAHQALRVVGESSILFAGTVQSNLLLGVRGEVSEGDMDAALFAAGADEVVREIEGGLQGEVGDRGLTLSGGQRQRLALARALITRPRVLVLDDALSAVQPALELEIISRMRAFDPAMSILFITRRNNAATVADATYVLPEPEELTSLVGQPTDDQVGETLATAERAAAGLSELSKDSQMRTLVETLELSTERPPADQEGSREDLRPTLRSLSQPLSRPASLALVCAIVTTFTQTVPALLLGKVTDQANNGELSGVSVTALVTAGLGVVAGLATYWYTINSALLSQGLVYQLRRRIARRVTQLGIDYYDRELPGQVATRVVTDMGNVAGFLSGSLFFLIVQLITITTSLTLIGIVAPGLLMTVVTLAALLLGITWFGTKLADRALSDARRQLGTVVTKMEEDFTAVFEIRNLGATDERTRQFVAASVGLRRRRRRVIAISTTYSQLVDFVGAIAATVILLQASNLVLAGTLTVGVALALQALTKIATQSFAGFGFVYMNGINTVVSWRRLQEIYDAPVLPEQRGLAVTCPPLAGEVIFADVTFTYPHTGSTVLRDLDASIPAGCIVALVGNTGAGKSSVTKLLQRAYDPCEGAVLVDRMDIRDLDLATYRQRIGVVPQDAYLFRGTVASNIAYGDHAASADEIAAAVDAVGATACLEALPGGFDAFVAEGGSNLTGAQRQVIAIARAWLTRPAVLVLDEATSALDAATERAVLSAVQGLGCTTIAVTHRESVVSIADLILVMDGGRIVESGPPSDLVGAGGAYDRLWRADVEPTEDGSAERARLVVS